MQKRIFGNIVAILLFPFVVNAQFGLSHEVGVFVGGVAFQSEFGVRHDFETNLGNTGFGVGLVHYLDFSYLAGCPSCKKRYTLWNDHFKVRSELSYNSTKLEHFGKWADKNSWAGTQLKNMKGETKVTDIGAQLEYYIRSLRDYNSKIGAFNPFVALGAHYSFYSNDTYSELPGGLNNINNVYYKYLPDAWMSGTGSTWSVVSSVGTRYKLTEMSDLFVELRWQYYFDDWVDGLKKDPDLWNENKANDWNLWFHVGYIHYIE